MMLMLLAVADPGIETKVVLKKIFMHNTTKFKEKKSVK